MPSKKPNKAAKKPGKATPGKVSHKVAAPKKAARPQLKHTPMIATSKVTVKPNKPAPKPTAAKVTRAKPAPGTEAKTDAIAEITEARAGSMEEKTRIAVESGAP